MPLLMKLTPGSDSLGHAWRNAGDIVEVTEEHARLLLAIPDADFVVVASTTFSEVVNDTPAVNRPVQRPRPTSRNRE